MTRCFQRFHRLATQGIECRCRDKKAISARQSCVNSYENGSTQLANLLFQQSGVGDGVAGITVGQMGMDTGAVAIFVGQVE